jgi:hypothetical protein
MIHREYPRLTRKNRQALKAGGFEGLLLYDVIGILYASKGFD